ncbi:MAG: hypothetical protein HYS07_04890 [Chlamydiae bacterium]|nr:hypothetical protein [Chlamydiota bacterium]MBI3276227.1 hypothetical protein [Chlamydiota bacterium]
MQSKIYLFLAEDLDHFQRKKLKEKLGIIHSSSDLKQKWIYLGRNYERMLAWESLLGENFERVNYASKLQGLARRWKQPYLEWIAELGEKNNSFVWWSSKIAERDTMIDSLFHRMCYLRIAFDETQSDFSLILIVAEHDSVLRALADIPELRKRVCPHRSLKGNLPRFRWFYRWVRIWIRFLLNARKVLQDARDAGERESFPSSSGSFQKRVVIHTCIDESYFSNNIPQDRYFSGLAELLRKRGYEVLVIPWLSQIQRSLRSAFEWFHAHPGHYLIPEDFYSIFDYVWAASVVIRQAWLVLGKHSFEGLNISSLVREFCRDQACHKGGVKFILYYRLIKKLSKKGFSIDIFIDMFENMLNEKPQVIAFRQWMPKTMTVGFEHYIAMEPFMMSKYTTPKELTISPHPDVIVCNSPFMVAQMQKAGFPSGKLRVGPSFRYLHFFSKDSKKAPEPNTVLVVLSLDRMATLEVLLKLVSTFPRDEGIRFWVKRHPMMSEKGFHTLLARISHHISTASADSASSLRADSVGHTQHTAKYASHGLGRLPRIQSGLDALVTKSDEKCGLGMETLPSHMICVGGAISDWLSRAACAVIAASTTASLEIALAAVPCVRVGRETDFNMDPLEWFSEFDPPVYSVEELRKQVLKKLSFSEEERTRLKIWAEEMKKECLSTINEDTISAFVKPKEASSQKIFQEALA